MARAGDLVVTVRGPALPIAIALKAALEALMKADVFTPELDTLFLAAHRALDMQFAPPPDPPAALDFREGARD